MRLLTKLGRRVSQLPKKRKYAVGFCAVYLILGTLNASLSAYRYPRDQELAKKFDVSPSCSFDRSQFSGIPQSNINEPVEKLCRSEKMTVLKAWTAHIYRGGPLSRVQLRDARGQDLELTGGDRIDQRSWDSMRTGDSAFVLFMNKSPVALNHANGTFQTTLNPHQIVDNDAASWFVFTGLLIGCTGIIIYNLWKAC